MVIQFTTGQGSAMHAFDSLKKQGRKWRPVETETAPRAYGRQTEPLVSHSQRTHTASSST